MNYRHAYHAGNFADLIKHAALLWLLDRLMEDPTPLLIVDTHAGAGLYDLAAPDAARSGEAREGVLKLAASVPPAPLARLSDAVAALNSGGEIKTYPGSPHLIVQALRPPDRYVGCELRDDDFGRLQTTVRRAGQAAAARQADGYDTAVALAREAGDARLFVLIDPPFEQPDDYQRIAETLDQVSKLRVDAQALVWLPLKDLETLDAFARDLERRGLTPALMIEARLRPLTDPLKMNGCALLALRPPPGFDKEALALSQAVTALLGQAGAAARVWRLNA